MGVQIMNGKRAKVLRKVANHLYNTLEYSGDRTERQVYQHVKKADNKLTTPQKEIFSVNQIRSTLP